MKKTFNVTCMTVRSANDTHTFFHLPVRKGAVAEVDGTAVHFNSGFGEEYELQATRSGLGGGTVLGLGFGDGMLELYTDTPFEGEPAHVTPEFLQKAAEGKMKELWGIVPHESM